VESPKAVRTARRQIQERVARFGRIGIVYIIDAENPFGAIANKLSIEDNLSIVELNSIAEYKHKCVLGMGWLLSLVKTGYS
jgi:hypothetical protein